MKPAFLLLLSITALHGAAATYSNLPYRGRADSPFFSSVQAGKTLVEDFEDGVLNTTGLTLPVGRVSITGRNSVDEDDGRLDNLGVGFHWLVSGALLNGETWFSAEIKFEMNSLGHYPTHAGLAMLGLMTTELGAKRLFQAYDFMGLPIAEAFLSEPVPVYSGAGSSISTLGDRFFGLIYEGGISKILLAEIRIDHIQFGYGPIPEPGSAVLLLWSGLHLATRRRRSPAS